MTIKKYIIISTLVLTGCTSEDISNTPTEERLPLRLEATLSAGSPVTRAVDNQFESGDVLMSYVQHVRPAVGGGLESVAASPVYFTKGTADMEAVENVETTKKTSDLASGEALYWDNFSNSSSESTDLRTTGHGLRSYYGYCYNGGTPKTFLETTGVLTWETLDDQSTAEKLRKNDLLWSKTQDIVTYDHAKKTREGITVPFTHAMSKFTIVVVAGDGFVETDLDAATVTLNGMNQTATFSAPDAKVSNTSGSISVQMFGNPKTTAEGKLPSRAFEAMVVPATSLAEDKHLADINIAGNKYKVSISGAILTSWVTGIENKASKSGYNYKLTVTLNKQTVGVVATLANWDDVSATGNGEILFSADVKTIDKSNVLGLTNGDSFSLWRSMDKSDMGSIVTTVSYNGSNFVNSPAIYWPNIKDNYFFRALAEKTNDHLLKAVTTTDVAQGTDLLWGTTAAHEGTEVDGSTKHSYEEGAAIKPRTGLVPLVFKHAMSNVTISLDSEAGDAYVDYKGATITLDKIYKNGSIDIASGNIGTTGSAEIVTLTDATIMVPQSLDGVMLEITLSDNATKYKLPLNACVDKSSNKISKWESGKDYTYTIKLTKEAVNFLVQVENWTPASGSGDATLDW